MTDLATVLAHALAALRRLEYPYTYRVGTFPLDMDATPRDLAEAIIATPEGTALAALVEAALAWRDFWDPRALPFTSTIEQDLAIAIDAYREATK